MIPLHDDNPTERFPFVTVIMMILCVAIYLYQGSLPELSEETFVFHYGAVPALLFGHASLPDDMPSPVPASMTLLTSMFLHAGWMHLLGNMLYLWIFGNNIEDVMGHGRFAIFYMQLWGLVFQHSADLGHQLLYGKSIALIIRHDFFDELQIDVVGGAGVEQKSAGHEQSIRMAYP